MVRRLLAGPDRVNTCRSGICWSGYSRRHSVTTYGTSAILAPRMNDSPAASIAIRLVSDTIPASATTVTCWRIGQASPEAPSLEEDGAVGQANQYPPELRERAVGMVAEVRPDYSSQWAAITVVARELGIS